MIIAFYKLIELYPLLAYFLLGILYLCVGSFLNVVIYRLPIILKNSLQAECLATLKLPIGDLVDNINLAIPASHCVKCKCHIRIWQNIPLLSFILLKARCANCQQKINWAYPLVELTCLLLSLIASVYFGINWKLLFILPFIWIMICLTFIDVHHQLLPDSLTLGLLWLGLIANSYGLYTTLADALYAAILGYVSLWLFIRIYYLLTGKVGMGGGDFKLFAALGAWFGMQALPNILLLAAIPGVLFGIVYLLIKKKSKNTPIAFGPFLAIAGLINLFIKV